MASYRNMNLCFYCKRFNHRQEDCRTRIQDKQPCTDARGRKYWPRQYTDEETTQEPISPISALTNYVTPLMGSRSVLTQIILNLCLASLTTCNKIYDIFATGEKIRPRVNVRTGNQTTSWLFDTGAAITCMNSRSFNAAFGNQKTKKIANAQICVAASGDAMNSIGIYEIDFYIKGQKFTHPVNVINELNDNIIGIDFMHRNKLVYDVNTRQVKFADEKMNTISATKQITIPAMTSSIIPTKFNRDSHPDKTYIAMIHCPGAPTLTGVPSLVIIDNNQNCKVVIENCAPYDVTIERNDIMGIIEMEEDKMYPLTDDATAKICAII
jgi:predicted aspartyl protease